MSEPTYRVFAQSPSGKSSLQCNLSYAEAHEAAEVLVNDGWLNVKILQDQPSLAHVLLREPTRELRE
jgi:hypothetical protein